MANAPGQICAKENTMADCAKANIMAVCARVDAIGEYATGNLQRRRVLRTTNGRRSNVGSDCSKTNF